MKYIFSMTLALALLASAPALAQGRIDVMTQNQYLGADLTPILTAGTPQEFNEAVVAALEEVAANDFPTRAGLLAKLIANRLPDLVGLQEVFTFTCTDLAPPTPGQGCDNPRISNAFNDHLSLTLAALVALEEPYSLVASVTNLDTTNLFVPPVPIAGIPFTIGGFPAVANITDHDVILAPSDDAGSVVPVPYNEFCAMPSADLGPGCNYQAFAPAPLPGGLTLEILRGWVGVDATVDGQDYRFVNTHLEVQRPDGSVQSSLIQAFQAAELIGVLGASTPPNKSLLVVGDINSSSEDPIIPGPWPPPFDQSGIIPPYTQFVGSGYTDTWTVTGDIPGFSCCQESDLSNHSSILDERIDVIFSAEAPNKVKKARVLGAKVSSKTPPPGLGLWPSDHGSVAAELQF
jgi:hypothetical protein